MGRPEAGKQPGAYIRWLRLPCRLWAKGGSPIQHLSAAIKGHCDELNGLHCVNTGSFMPS